MMPVPPAEKLLRAALKEFGVRFRTSERVLNTTPSMVVSEHKVAVFVDGCDEAQCPWHYPKKKSPQIWKRFNDRDARLRKAGWAVVRVWQHEVESAPRIVAGRIALVIHTSKRMAEKAQKKT